MPEYKINLVRRGSIFDRKSKSGFETAFPGMTGNAYRFFVQINRTTRNKAQGTANNIKGTRCKAEYVALFSVHSAKI